MSDRSREGEPNVEQEAKEEAKKQIVEAFIQGGFERAFALADEHKLNDQEREELKTQSLYEAIRRCKLENAREIAFRSDLGYLRDLATDPEIRPIFIEGIVTGMKGGAVNAVRLMIVEIGFQPDEIRTPEFQELAQASALRSLSKGNIDAFNVWVSIFGLSSEFVASEQAREAASKGIKQAHVIRSPQMTAAIEKVFGISGTVEAKPEVKIERTPNQGEVENIFKQLLPAGYESVEPVIDAEGLKAWDVKAPGDQPGVVLEYSYRRKVAERKFTVSVTRYEDEFPVSDVTVAEFVNGAWKVNT